MKELDKVYAKKIAEEYAPKTTSKVIKLKKLDDKVKRPVKIISYLVGSFGALVAGTGMSIYMTDFGPSGKLGLILSIVLGIVGLVICVINYPIYSKVLKSRKEKYAFEIIELAKEIEEN